jgi:two-component system chemotaxis response regulator CheY
MHLGKILIVEDSLLHQKMYDIMLHEYRRDGVVMLHADHGQDALAQLSDHPDIDLILLDVNMPVMSGLEFLRQLKAEDAFRTIPVIICSTEGKDDDILRGLRMGAMGYLKKPFKPEDLIALIERVKRLPQPVQACGPGAHAEGEQGDAGAS